MPEHAEIRLSSAFASEVSRGVTYTKISKSDVSKVKIDLDIFDGNDFWITSESRGKQLKIICTKSGTTEKKELLIGMGMSGLFARVTNTATETGKKIMKHSHLQFHSKSGDILVLHDVRRFAKWKWVENGTWASDRGYDAVTEYPQFKQTILDNWQTHKAFERPVSTLLLNQKWFNGVGNYLRAEILYRVPDVNPWTPGNQLTKTQITNIIEQCELCFETAFDLQKTERKSVREHPINEWMKIYGKKTSSYALDDNKRKFWFDPKWNSQLPQKYKKDKYLLKE